MKNLSLLLLSASLVVVLSHCKRNAFEKADAGEESESGKLQSHRNDCSATLVPVRAYLERRRDASTRERARPPLWLPSSFSFSSSSPFLFLRGILSLFQQREERKEPMKNGENTPERRIRSSLCAKKKHLHDKGASRRVKVMRRASRWNGVHWFYEHSFDLAFKKETAVISASRSLLFYWNDKKI